MASQDSGWMVALKVVGLGLLGVASVGAAAVAVEADTNARRDAASELTGARRALRRAEDQFGRGRISLYELRAHQRRVHMLEDRMNNGIWG